MPLVKLENKTDKITFILDCSNSKEIKDQYREYFQGQFSNWCYMPLPVGNGELPFANTQGTIELVRKNWVKGIEDGEIINGLLNVNVFIHEKIDYFKEGYADTIKKFITQFKASFQALDSSFHFYLIIDKIGRNGVETYRKFRDIEDVFFSIGDEKKDRQGAGRRETTIILMDAKPPLFDYNSAIQAVAFFAYLLAQKTCKTQVDNEKQTADIANELLQVVNTTADGPYLINLTLSCFNESRIQKCKNKEKQLRTELFGTIDEDTLDKMLEDRLWDLAQDNFSEEIKSISIGDIPIPEGAVVKTCWFKRKSPEGIDSLQQSLYHSFVINVDKKESEYFTTERKKTLCRDILVGIPLSQWGDVKKTIEKISKEWPKKLSKFVSLDGVKIDAKPTSQQIRLQINKIVSDWKQKVSKKEAIVATLAVQILDNLDAYIDNNLESVKEEKKRDYNDNRTDYISMLRTVDGEELDSMLSFLKKVPRVSDHERGVHIPAEISGRKDCLFISSDVKSCWHATQDQSGETYDSAVSATGLGDVYYFDKVNFLNGKEIALLSLIVLNKNSFDTNRDDIFRIGDI